MALQTVCLYKTTFYGEQNVLCCFKKEATEEYDMGLLILTSQTSH